MSTTYTPNLALGLSAAGDRTWNFPLNASISALDALSPIGGLNVTLTEVPSASLNVRVSAGQYVQQDGTIGTYAGTASQAVAGTSTKVLYLDLTSSGALTVAAGFPSTAHVRLATVVAGGSTITSITDARVACTVIGSFLDGINWSFGTTTGTQIGTSTSQKLGFFGATPVVQQTLGVATASSSWTATEQGMLQRVYNAVRALGLGS